jgi:hypothetical protein
MKTTIEYSGPVTIFGGIPLRSLIQVCGWCDKDKAITNQLIRSGFRVSHGICKEHQEEWLAEMNHETPKPPLKLSGIMVSGSTVDLSGHANPDY